MESAAHNIPVDTLASRMDLDPDGRRQQQETAKSRGSGIQVVDFMRMDGCTGGIGHSESSILSYTDAESETSIR
jgi:hypothetical protein